MAVLTTYDLDQFVADMNELIATKPDQATIFDRGSSYLERLVIRDGAEIRIISAAAIDFVRGQDDYIEVFHEARSSLTQQTLQSLEASLDPRQFVRVHRSYLLNVSRVARIEPWGNGSKMAVLNDGRTVPISRSGETRLRTTLGL